MSIRRMDSPEGVRFVTLTVPRKGPLPDLYNAIVRIVVLPEATEEQVAKLKLRVDVSDSKRTILIGKVKPAALSQAGKESVSVASKASVRDTVLALAEASQCADKEALRGLVQKHMDEAGI